MALVLWYLHSPQIFKEWMLYEVQNFNYVSKKRI